MLSIVNARKHILILREDVPSITDLVIQSFWDNSFLAAQRSAEQEMDCVSAVQNLTWQEVFDDEYVLPFPRT
jgi:hypothetical protein